MRGTHPERALEIALARQLMLRAGETVVAAVSGGPDSVALGAALAAACEAAGATLVLAHVNHGVRRGAWQDEAVVLALGATLGVRTLVAARAPGTAAEERLRDERYAALARIARACGAERIVTAHHARDQSETVLLALLRGAGPDGLTGMLAARELEAGIRLERPLLRVEPGALRAYCAAQHLAYALDPSNDDLSLRRNAVRDALDGLRHAFPHLDAAIARCAAILRDEREGVPRAAIRSSVRVALAAEVGLRDVPFERLDAAARAIESGSPGRHFLRRGVEIVIE